MDPFPPSRTPYNTPVPSESSSNHSDNDENKNNMLNRSTNVNKNSTKSEASNQGIKNKRYFLDNGNSPWGHLIYFPPKATPIVQDLIQPNFIIGRSPECDIIVALSTVSNQHLEIFIQGPVNQLYLSSMNHFGKNNKYPSGDQQLPQQVEDIDDIVSTHDAIRNQPKCFIRDTSMNGTYISFSPSSEHSKTQKTRIHSETIDISSENMVEIHIPNDHYFVFYPRNNKQIVNQLMNPVKEEHKFIQDKYFLFQNQTLGIGSYASVKLAIDLQNGERVAAKVIPKMRLNSKNESVEIQGIKQEVQILTRIKHPNIIEIKDVFEYGDSVILFLERIKGGDLFEFIQKRSFIEEYEAKFFFYQILLASKHLHECNITHRDLKPENLLLEYSKPWTRLIITDFGMAKQTNHRLERMKTKCGTLSYLAPEVISGASKNGYSKKVDCWSLGKLLHCVLLYAMVSGFLPFGSDESPNTLLKNIQNSVYQFPEQDGWNNKSDKVKDLISHLLVVDPNERYSVEDALAHPWINDQRILLDKLYGKIVLKRV